MGCKVSNQTRQRFEVTTNSDKLKSVHTQYAIMHHFSSTVIMDLISVCSHLKCYLRPFAKVLAIIIFLFLNQNICCGYSKELSQRDGSFEHPKRIC